jgi:hypothetical protein
MSDAGLGADGCGMLRCPTCQARQEWSDLCRRCKCDLALLRRTAEAHRDSRRRCLLALRAGRARLALEYAGYAYLVSPDADTARLVAVCHFLLGNWDEALAAGRAAAERASVPGEWP